MKELDIKIGYQCNNACVFCLNKDKRQYQEFPLKTLEKQIEMFALQGGEKLIISGGEPSIQNNFFRLISFAKEKGIKFLEIQTNGRMFYYEEMIRMLKKFEPLGFLISLHFPNHRLYKKYCRSNGFNQVIGGIRNLVKYNCNFTVNTVIMKQSLPYLKNLIGLLKKEGVKRSQYRFIDGKNVIDNYKEFVPRYSECLTLIKEIIKENPDIHITLREIPVCVIGEKLKNYLSPRLNPERLNLAINNNLVTTHEIITAQSAFPNCQECIYKSSYCEGVRKEYAQMYGIKEIKPIIKRFLK